MFEPEFDGFLTLFKCIRPCINVETEPIRTEGEWVLLGGRKIWGKVGKGNFWGCLAILLWWENIFLVGQPKMFGVGWQKNGSGVAKYFRIGVAKIFGGLDGNFQWSGMARYSRGEAWQNILG